MNATREWREEIARRTRSCRPKIFTSTKSIGAIPAHPVAADAASAILKFKLIPGHADFSKI
jgi:hypothetical protein